MGFVLRSQSHCGVCTSISIKLWGFYYDLSHTVGFVLRSHFDVSHTVRVILRSQSHCAGHASIIV